MSRPFLIVEDDEVVLKFTKTVLTRSGHRVMTATTIAEARTIIDQNPNIEDLCLVVDVVLQHESGISFAQEIVQTHGTFRVLLISGFTDEVLMTEPLHVKQIAFLRKPFTKPDLLAAVDRICGAA